MKESTIGLRIKNRRKELNLSADDLAKKIGKNRATIYRYEDNSIEELPISILYPLSEALDTSIDYLLGEKSLITQNIEFLIEVYDEKLEDLSSKTSIPQDRLENFIQEDVELTESELKIIADRFHTSVTNLRSSDMRAHYSISHLFPNKLLKVTSNLSDQDIYNLICIINGDSSSDMFKFMLKFIKLIPDNKRILNNELDKLLSHQEQDPD